MSVWFPRLRLTGVALMAVLVAALAISAALPAAGSTTAGVEDQVRVGDDFLADSVDALGATGGAWAVVRHGRVEHVGVAGSDGRGEPWSEHTPVFLGSVSKPLLATVVMDLAAADRVNLDRPVVGELPEFGVVEGADDVTPRQLLSHTSGLPFGADHLDLTDPDRTATEVVADLGDLDLESPPGERYGYSSLGYVVLTAWVEEATGRPLTSLLHDLGLTDLSTDGDVVPPGRRGMWLPPQTTDADPAGMGYGYAVGSVDTLADLATESLADPDRLAAMTDVRPDSGQTLTGLGWRVTADDDGARRVWHTGTVPGSFTAVHLVPDEDLAVVIVLNRSGTLEESRLYAASAGLLASARGQSAATIGPPWTTYGVLAGVLLACLIGVLLARRWWLVGFGAGVVLLAAAPIALIGLGYPLRYAWLWVPDVAGAIVIAGAVVLLTAIATAVRRVRPHGGDRQREV